MVPPGPTSRRQVPGNHLARGGRRDQSVVMAEGSDSEVLDAILISCQYLHVKLDQILEIFGNDGQEEDETDS